VAHTHHTLLAAMDLAMVHKQAVQDALGKCHVVLAALLEDLVGGASDVTATAAASTAYRPAWGGAALAPATMTAAR
jgi:hypothetical protein